jgi:hypothetical protein
MSLPKERVLTLAPEELRRRQFAALTGWTIAGARVQPLVLVFEDLHWADPTTLDLLRGFSERGALAPLFMSHHAAKTDLSVTSTPPHSEKASVEEHVPHATDITTFANSSQQDKGVGTVLPPPTHVGECARPQDASTGRHAKWRPAYNWNKLSMALQQQIVRQF